MWKLSEHFSIYRLILYLLILGNVALILQSIDNARFYYFVLVNI